MLATDADCTARAFSGHMGGGVEEPAVPAVPGLGQLLVQARIPPPPSSGDLSWGKEFGVRLRHR